MTTPIRSSSPSVFGGLLVGAIAGAAGATALNLATYIDMAVRARPASQAPEQLVEELVIDQGATLPGDPDERKTRAQALGPVSGLLTGIAVGSLAGAARAGGVRLPGLLAAPLVGAVAMAAADVPLAVTGVSDPRTWSAADWAADAVPHLMFGTVVHATLALFDWPR